MTRDQVIAEARTWLRTPYKRRARLKGVGCDCFTFLFEVYRAAGFLPPGAEGEPDATVLSDDWFQHTTDERYMRWVLRHASKIAEGISYPSLEALPGDIVLTRSMRSKVYNHGAIVVAWPQVIHCQVPAVVEANAATHPLWAHQQVAVFDPWAKEQAS